MNKPSFGPSEAGSARFHSPACYLVQIDLVHQLVHHGGMVETVVNIHEAKTHFSRLVERAEHGERITIARDGVPVAMLVALEVETKVRRPIGMDRGKVIIHPNFDDPLPELDDHADDPIEPAVGPEA